MAGLILAAAAIAYLPGALIFRWPAWGRDRRAALGADERIFWHIVISAAWSLAVVLVLGAFDAYRFSRVLAINGGLVALLLASGRTRLWYRGTAARPGWFVLLPVALVALGCWRFFPSAEYIIGGKDPGVYISEGVQIAKTGSLYIREPLVASLPEGTLGLFFPPSVRGEFYSNRFMGFYLGRPPSDGRTIGQFPHLYPASIALAYELGGLAWAREVVGVWAILGLVAVYFAGARFLGRGVAVAGAALLGLSVLQIWFARSPSSEPAMQALLWAAMLAFARAHQDDDRFFGPVAGVLLGLLLFVRIDAFMAVAAVTGAGVAAFVVKGLKPKAGFAIPLVAACMLGWYYLLVIMGAYSLEFRANLPRVPPLWAAGGAIAAVAVVVILERIVRPGRDLAARALPWALVIVVIAGAADAWFLRVPKVCQAPCDKLADYDAYALRTFTEFFLTPWGLVAALVGFVLVVRRQFWRDPALVLTVSGFALAFFYKIRIQPFQFWLNRRFLPVVLPGVLLFIAAAAIGAMAKPRRALAWSRTAVGVVFLGWLGWQFTVAAAPVARHVEYAGMTAHMEQLAALFTAQDLVIVESRNSGTDIHVLGMPLDYLYGRSVLNLDSPVPDKTLLRAFLEFATGRYAHVYFVGGGTDLLSRHILARPVTSRKILVSEYSDTAWNEYPNSERTKVFDFGVYELSLGSADAVAGFAHDIGAEDDLYVARFYARDFNQKQPMRWTRDSSLIFVPGLVGKETDVVLTMHDGGRPKEAPPARVEVFFNDVSLGIVDVGGPDFKPYRLALPPELARRAAAVEGTAQIRLKSTTWNPQKLNVSATDSRDLGVMLSRVEVH